MQNDSKNWLKYIVIDQIFFLLTKVIDQIKMSIKVI